MIGVHHNNAASNAGYLDNLPDCPSAALEDAFEIVSEIIAETISLTLRKPLRIRQLAISAPTTSKLLRARHSFGFSACPGKGLA